MALRGIPEKAARRLVREEVPDFELSKVTAEPLLAHSVREAMRVLGAGADKVSVNSPALERPALIAELAEAFGVQCVVVGIDSLRDADGQWVHARIDDCDASLAAPVVDSAPSCRENAPTCRAITAPNGAGVAPPIGASPSSAPTKGTNGSTSSQARCG